MLKKTDNWFRLYLDVLVLDGLALGLFLILPWFPLSMVLFVLLGMVGAAHSIIFNSVLQQSVSDRNRGKVFSMFYMLSSPIAIVSITAGTAAAAMVTAKVVLLVSAGIEIISSVFLRFTRTYRESGESDESEIKMAA